MAITMQETILTVNGSHREEKASGKYAMAVGQPTVLSDQGSDHAPLLVHIDNDEYPKIAGLSAILRLKVILSTNETAPGGNYTFGIYPVTRPADGKGGGKDQGIYKIIDAVPGSDTTTFINPPANSILVAVGEEFPFPPDGFYTIGLITSDSVAPKAHVHINAILQVRYA